MGEYRAFAGKDRDERAERHERQCKRDANSHIRPPHQNPITAGLGHNNRCAAVDRQLNPA